MHYSKAFFVWVASIAIHMDACLLLILGHQNVEQGPNTELVSRLRGASSPERVQASAAIRRLGSKAAHLVPGLLEALGDGDQAVRFYSANCLGHIGPGAKGAISTLAKMADDKNEAETVRVEASLAMGRIGPDSLSALIDLLRTGSDLVARSSAASAIGKMGAAARPAIPQLVSALGATEYDIWNAASSSLIAIGTESVAHLERAIAAPTSRSRVHAGLTLLSLQPDHDLVPAAMVKELEDPTPDVRRCALLALELASKDKSIQKITGLMRSLRDRDAGVREVAARCLAPIGPSARLAIPALIDAMRDSEFEVRGYAATALGNIGDRSGVVMAALVKALDDDEDDVKLLVVRALGNLGPSARSALPKLTDMLRSTEEGDELKPAIEASISRIRVQ